MPFPFFSKLSKLIPSLLYTIPYPSIHASVFRIPTVIYIPNPYLSHFPCRSPLAAFGASSLLPLDIFSTAIGDFPPVAVVEFPPALL